MPRKSGEKMVEAFIDELDLILYDDEQNAIEKLRNIKSLCVDTRLAIMVEELS